MLNWKAFFAVVVMALILSVPLYSYWEFLTQGTRPPEATQILNQMEKAGVPDFTLLDLQGKPVALSSFRGKIVLINIWATWCTPCVKEFPSLKRLVEHFKGQVVVLAVSHDKNVEDIESFIRAFNGLPENFVVVWDQEKVTGKIFGTNALPETYILSREQKLIRKIAGDTEWDTPLALEFFKDLLEPAGDKKTEQPLPKRHPQPDGIKTH